MSITSQLSTALADRYKIERHLGEGGMATVYLAQDVKHDRKVALKVLRPELAAVIGAERFLQEIKVTANLQHPHILPLHDSGEAGSFLYYVMPFVKGDTLRDKLDRERQLDITEAIEITRSVASALDYAHRQGVIHRDIKPENVLLHDGQALIADFGIALAVSHASGTRLTETGLSIGTPHYMSPEQAMGDRELDARSDIYSLGAMLYEMLAGDPPYTGTTAQAIVAKVITEKAPPVTATRDTVPGHVAAAIAKALAKMPADRFRSAAVFGDALTDPTFTMPSAAAPVEMGAAVTGISRRVKLAIGAGGFALVALGLFLGRSTAPEPEMRLARFAVAGPDSGFIIGRCCGRSIALSPDGRRVVFLASSQTGIGPLYRREMEQLAAEPIPGTEGASIPFFSPDGRWLGFFFDGYIRKVSMSGGPPVPIAQTPRASGASWGDNDVIVFRGDSGLYTVPSGGGEPMLVAHNQQVVHPFMLPGGLKALVSLTDPGLGPPGVRIGIADLEKGTIDTIGFGTRAEYASGFLVFTGADATLLAQPFDASKGRTMGQAVALLGDVQFRGNNGMGEFAVSPAGDLVYEPGGRGLAGNTERLEIATVRGRTEVVLPQESNLEDPSFSPDGRRIAIRMVGLGETQDVWVFDREQGTLSRLTVEGNNRTTVWSRDGRRIAFSSNREPPHQIYWKPSDRSGPAERLLRTDYQADPGSWLPDGQTLLISADRPGTERDIGRFTIGDSVPTWILETEFEELFPQGSPDGRWLAYSSDVSGTQEVYVQAMEGASGQYQVSVNGGLMPRWSPDGSTLFYVSSNSLVGATIVTDPEFHVAERTELFGGLTDINNVNSVNYDIHPNGEEFIVIGQGTGGGSGGSVVWILDWPEIVWAAGTGR